MAADHGAAVRAERRAAVHQPRCERVVAARRSGEDGQRLVAAGQREPRDGMRTADFFDVEKNPEITFKSSRLEKKGKGFIAHGTFNMRGVSKEIALPFTINGVNRDEKTGKTTLGATARTTINRKDYGVSFSQPANPTFLGDMVEIELNIITRAASPQ